MAGVLIPMRPPGRRSRSRRGRKWTSVPKYPNADDGVELVITERQVAGVRVDHGHSIGHPGRLEDGAQVSLVDPPIHRRELGASLSSEEDRRGPFPAAEVEHPVPWAKVQFRQQVLQLPQRMGPHVEAAYPVRVVPARERVPVGPIECVHDR